jgi:hypothetical protein
MIVCTDQSVASTVAILVEAFRELILARLVFLAIGSGANRSGEPLLFPLLVDSVEGWNQSEAIHVTIAGDTLDQLN